MNLDRILTTAEELPKTAKVIGPIIFEQIIFQPNRILITEPSRMKAEPSRMKDLPFKYSGILPTEQEFLERINDYLKQQNKYAVELKNARTCLDILKSRIFSATAYYLQ